MGRGTVGREDEKLPVVEASLGRAVRVRGVDARQALATLTVYGASR
jgi:hypothetical protein